MGFAGSALADTSASLLTSDDFLSDSVDHFIGDAVGGVYDLPRHEWDWLGLGMLGVFGLATYLNYQWVDDEINDTILISDAAPYADIVNALSFSAYATPFLFFSAGLFYNGQDPRRQRSWSVAEELFETLGFSVSSTFLTKYFVDRTSPAGSNDNSFPSGHSSAAWAAATILAYHYPWYVGAAALAFATLVSIERFDSRDHFPADLLAGIGIGMFWAQAVHTYHRSLRAIQPQVAQNFYGLTYRWVF